MKYQQLALEQRVLISRLTRQVLNPSQVVLQPGRRRSAVSRELTRNTCYGYSAFY
jgi:IS30 family transposase